MWVMKRHLQRAFDRVVRQNDSKQTTIRSQILPRNDLEGMGEIRLNAAFIGTYFEIV